MSEPAISKLAEQRMRQWAIGLEVKQRIAQEEAVKQLPEQVYPSNSRRPVKASIHQVFPLVFS
jgi:hypothetical protein